MSLDCAGSEPLKPFKMRILKSPSNLFCVEGTVFLEKYNFLLFMLNARFLNPQIMLIKTSNRSRKTIFVSWAIFGDVLLFYSSIFVFIIKIER